MKNKKKKKNPHSCLNISALFKHLKTYQEVSLSRLHHHSKITAKKQALEKEGKQEDWNCWAEQNYTRMLSKICQK